MEGSANIKVREALNALKTILKSIKKINKKHYRFFNGILMVFGLILVSFWP